MSIWLKVRYWKVRNWIHFAWRNVNSANYRQLCARCGIAGQAHISGEGCRRFQ